MLSESEHSSLLSHFQTPQSSLTVTVTEGLFSSLLSSFLSLHFYLFRILIPSPQSSNPCTPSSPSTPQSIHGSAELDGRRLSLTVVGLRSKIQPEIEVDSPPTQHCRPSPPRSRFESHFHPVNGFWFLFYVFVFRHQSGKPIFA